MLLAFRIEFIQKSKFLPKLYFALVIFPVCPGREDIKLFKNVKYCALHIRFIVACGVLALFLIQSTVNAQINKGILWGPDLSVEVNTANTTKSKNLEMVVDFVEQGFYLGWPHDPYVRPTGDIYKTTKGKLIDGSTHHRVRIYYSPSVAEWLKEGRPKDKKLPDRSMIVKEMYKTEAPIYPEEDPVIGWAVMVKKDGASHDGWYWVIYFKEEFRSMDTMAEFSYSFCLTCHASTESEATFSSLKNLTGENAATYNERSIIEVVDPLFFTNLLDKSGKKENTPLKKIDKQFKALYSDPAIYPYTDGAPKYKAEKVGRKFPNSDWDHVWNRIKPPDQSYLTSDNCIGCHDATLLVETQVPNMLIRKESVNELTGESGNEQINLSVYGEWRSSPMGMAGRDPIFFAQLESETKTYPELAGFIQNKCLSCHGAMGQRQFHEDKKKHKNKGIYKKEYFDIPMVYQTGHEPYAKYGALARDGISCMICHQMDAKSIPGANTGDFTRGKWNEIYASTAPNSGPGGPIRTWPMEQALGFTPKYAPYINKSEMCGVCHVIVLPVEKPDSRFHASHPLSSDKTVMLSEAHEQDTFLEWFYSAYQNSNPDIPVNKATAATCQDCHMSPTFQGNGQKVGYKVANVENTSWPSPPAENLAPAEKISVPNRPNVGRHTLFGMNLFVLNMYRQFDDTVFGLMEDSNPPMGTTNSYDFAIENGEWQIKNVTAGAQILDVKRDGKDLVARVRVTNRAGHRLPSGVGFRRAWIEFQVKDKAGAKLWGSGVTDSNGVIVKPDGKTPIDSEFTGDWEKLEPHWVEITSQEHAQIYEERYINEYENKEGKKELRLTTSFLGIGMVVKDNRLQPLGYYYDYLKHQYEAAKKSGDTKLQEKFASLLPESKLPVHKGSINPDLDEDYRNGSGADVITYRIPLKDIEGAAVVTAQLNYQNIPPYYLRDRFSIGLGKQTQRLYYLVGHTKVKNSAIEDWKIEIAKATAPVPQL